ncbi:MAG: TetR/AcrR family transcriptional regulator [Aestuariivirga sp.]
MQAVKPKRPRGRPKSEATQQAILSAAAAMIHDSGVFSVTMEAVAERAGVSKPTIYRSWPNREALAMAALMHTPRPSTAVRESASALDDLRKHLIKTVAAFASPQGRNAALILASAEPNTELAKAFRTHVLRASREQGRALIARAQAEGCVKTALDIEVTLDLLYGPIFYRLLIGHAQTTEPFALALIEHVLDGIRAGD